MSTRKDVTVVATPAVAWASTPAPKITVTMPVEWMLYGFNLALTRLRTALSTHQDSARDPCIALFEVSNWLDSLSDRFPQLKSVPHVQALIFARHRTHHGFAAALYRDNDSGEWTWYRDEILPLPDRERHLNEALGRTYEQVAAGRPLSKVLDHIERAVGKVDAAA